MASEVINRAMSHGCFPEAVSPGLPDSTRCFTSSLVDVRFVELFHHRPLSAPEGPAADPRRRQGKGLKKNVVGTRLGDVIGKLVKSKCPKIMNA